MGPLPVDGSFFTLSGVTAGEGAMIYKFAVRTAEDYDPNVAQARAQLQLADFRA